MTIRIMAIGDILGRPGRRIIREFLPGLREKWNIDCVIANIENSAGGFGITHKVYSELLRYGIDLMTSGNHVYDKADTVSWIEDATSLVRPYNYPPGSPGKTSASFTTASGTVVTVLNLLGRVFMKPYDCPFRGFDQWLDQHSENDIVLVDVHGEATSEKQAMGWYLAEKVSAVWGTHTHVPTNDARILSDHTGFITDLGMTGPYHSVIGMKIPGVLEGFKTMKKNRFEVANGDLRLGCCIFDIHEDTKKCTRVTPLVKSYDELVNEIAC